MGGGGRKKERCRMRQPRNIIHNKSDLDKFLPLDLCWCRFREMAVRGIPDIELETRFVVAGSAEVSRIKVITLHQMSFS
jgi:hypothetical protein